MPNNTKQPVNLIIVDKNEGLVRSAKTLIESQQEHINVFTCNEDSTVFSLAKEGNIDMVAIDEEKMTTQLWLKFMHENPKTKVINLFEFYASID